MIDKFPAVLNFNLLILKLNRFICSYPPVLPDHRLRISINTCIEMLEKVKSFTYLQDQLDVTCFSVTTMRVLINSASKYFNSLEVMRHDSFLSVWSLAFKAWIISICFNLCMV